jgi:hypothetical protein
MLHLYTTYARKYAASWLDKSRRRRAAWPRDSRQLLQMLSLLGLAAQPAAVCAATVSITFGPPVTIGGTGYVDAEQFPSGALAAANAEHVLARGAAASASWHAETVSGMGATASCTADPASCPGVCDVKTKHSREEKCPTAPEYYRWGGKFSPDLATDGEDLVDFGRLLPDDEKNRSWTAPNRSRYTYSASSGKLTVAPEATTIRFTGLPQSARLPPEVSSMIRLMGASWLDLVRKRCSPTFHVKNHRSFYQDRLGPN